MLDAMSNGNREQWDYFTEMNVMQFLNHMAFLKDKNKELERQLNERT